MAEKTADETVNQIIDLINMSTQERDAYRAMLEKALYEGRFYTRRSDRHEFWNSVRTVLGTRGHG